MSLFGVAWGNNEAIATCAGKHCAYVFIASFPGPRAAFGYFRLLQATKSWAGPGNEANVFIDLSVYPQSGKYIHDAASTSNYCSAL